MLGLIWGERPVRGRVGVRRGRRPALEGLEARIALSTATWNGSSLTSADWTDGANWVGGVAPTTGDDLVFPLGANQTTNTDDFPSGTTFHSITIQAPYTLNQDSTGDSLTLTSGITDSDTTGVSTIGFGLVLSAGPTPISVSAGGTLDLTNALSGPVGVSVSGGGTMDLSGTSSYTGTTTVGSATTLYVDGTIVGGMQLSGGVLRGNGTVNSVSSVGGTVSPGHTVTGTTAPGVLTVSAPSTSTTGASLTLDSGSTFATDLDGTSPGNGTTGYSQLVVSPAPTGATAGTISLGRATLSTTLDSGYSPSPGQQLTIISNGTGKAVSGIFSGLAEGAAVSAGDALFRISYAGGTDGQDVVLTDVAATGTTTTTLSPITSPVTYGQSIILTATVASTVTGNPAPTGTVEFFAGSPIAGGTEITSAALNGGIATASVSKLSVTGSPYQIYALYVPSSTSYAYAGSTSSSQSLTVNPATLSVSGVTGGNMEYSASTNDTAIDASNATLNGVISGDVVTLNTTNLTGTFSTANVGTNIPVTVSGLSLSGTNSADYVLQQPTGVTGNITPAPGLTLTASSFTISAGSAVPTLTFTASGFVGSDTSASLTTQPTLTTNAGTNPGPGTYTIQIGGAVDPNYSPISYVDGTLTVVQSYATTTTLTSSITSFAVTGQPVTLTATVAPQSTSAGTPEGEVGFFANNTLIGEAPLNPSTGTATFTTSSLGPGYNALVAAYASTNGFANSVSSTLNLYVGPTGTTPELTIVPVRGRNGKVAKFDLDVAVEAISPGSGTAIGTVTYFINGRARYQTISLTNGAATLAIPFQRLENQYVYVRYNGNRNFVGSSSANHYISRLRLLRLAKTDSSYGPLQAVRQDGERHPDKRS